MSRVKLGSALCLGMLLLPFIVRGQDTPKDLINLSGRWTGTISQVGVANGVPFVMTLDHIGKNISGNASVVAPNGFEVKNAELTGTFDGLSFRFREGKFLRNNGQWALIKGHLKATVEGEAMILSGSWQTVQPRKLTGQIRLQKKRPPQQPSPPPKQDEKNAQIVKTDAKEDEGKTVAKADVGPAPPAKKSAKGGTGSAPPAKNLVNGDSDEEPPVEPQKVANRFRRVTDFTDGNNLCGRVCFWFVLLCLMALVGVMMPNAWRNNKGTTNYLSALRGLVLNALAVAVFLWMLRCLFGELIPAIVEAKKEGVSIGELMAFLVTGEGHERAIFLTDSEMTVRWLDEPAQQADARRLAKLVPNPTDFRVALRWGETLVQHWRSISSQKTPDTPQLAAHFAWRRLTCAPGVRGDDLFTLRARVKEAVPDEASLQALLSWAKQRRTQKAQTAFLRNDGPEIPLAPAVPDTEWFRYWLLYEDWAVTDAVFEARKKQLLTLLDAPPRSEAEVWSGLLSLGKMAAAERREHGEALPGDDERAWLMAALDRITNLDGEREKLSKAKKRVFGATNEKGFVNIALFIAPNDDIFMTLAGDLMDVSPRTLDSGESELVRSGGVITVASLARTMVVELLIFVLLVSVFLYRGAYCATIWPGLLLGLRNKPEFQHYCDHHKNLLLQLPLLAITIGVNYVIAKWTQEPFWVLHVRTGAQFLIAVAWSTLLGGVILAALEHVFALAFLLAGKDPEKFWWDNILACLVGGMLLSWLQNSKLSILIYAAQSLAFSCPYKFGWWTGKNADLPEKSEANGPATTGAVRFDCPGCGRHLSVSVKAAGRRISCPRCGTKIAVPEQ